MNYCFCLLNAIQRAEESFQTALSAIGFNIAGEVKRFKAISRSIVSGNFTATEPVQLVQGGIGALVIKVVCLDWNSFVLKSQKKRTMLAKKAEVSSRK